MTRNEEHDSLAPIAAGKEKWYNSQWRAGEWLLGNVNYESKEVIMSYPFLTLSDDTEITHSELLPDGSVKVFVENPIYCDFHSATCMLPSYEWCDVQGFTDVELDEYRKMIANSAHLIMRYAERGGFLNAEGF